MSIWFVCDFHSFGVWGLLCSLDFADDLWELLKSNLYRLFCPISSIKILTTKRLSFSLYILFAFFIIELMGVK